MLGWKVDMAVEPMKQEKGFLVSHSLLYSSCAVTKLLDNPLAPSPRLLASAGKLVEKSNMNREVAELDHGAIHVVKIVVSLSWLAVVNTLGMTREENGFLLAQGGGSPSNHHSVTMNRYLA